MFISKDSAVLNKQNVIQEVTVSLSDSFVTTSGSTATIDFGEAVASVTAALFIDNSAGTVAPVTFANRAISGTTVTLTLSAAFASNDAIVIAYSTID